MRISRKFHTNSLSIFKLENRICYFYLLEYCIFKKVEIRRWICMDFPRISFIILYKLFSTLQWIVCLVALRYYNMQCIVRKSISGYWSLAIKNAYATVSFIFGSYSMEGIYFFRVKNFVLISRKWKINLTVSGVNLEKDN